MFRSIFIGFDRREASGFAVSRNSIKRHISQQIPIYGVVLDQLIALGLYKRPTRILMRPDGHRLLIDELSVRPDYDGRISTEHAIARFLVPHLAGRGWALWSDGDVLVRGNLARIFDNVDHSKALYCVKHEHWPSERQKMDGQLQTQYPRKNWSSVILWNVDHPANRRLTLELVNTAPGRDLHRFCWLEDDEIGELDPKWNWLVDASSPRIDPVIVHFTNGLPDMPGYGHSAYAEEWRSELALWARGKYPVWADQ